MRPVVVATLLAVLGGTFLLRPVGPPPSGACAQSPDAVAERIDCESEGRPVTGSCAATSASFRSVRVRPVRRGLRFGYTRRVDRPVRIDVFQVSVRRLVLGQRLVKRLRNRPSGVRWSGRPRRGGRLRDGVYFARFTIRDARGRRDVRRVALVRRGGRFRTAPPFYRRRSCATLTSFKLERPAFGGRRNRSLGIAYRLARPGTVSVQVRRGGRAVRRFRTTTRRARLTHRLRLGSEGLPRGRYEIRLRYTGEQGSLSTSLYSARL